MKTALLIIDMLNTLEFPEGKQLLRHALPVAKKIARLKERMKAKGCPVIYVNDNFGRWRSDQREVFEACAGERSLGHELARLLPPAGDDYFVLKPRNSGFFASVLPVLLEDLKARHLVLTGIAGNICVLYTAHDAHTRGYSLTVPRDCIASNTRRENEEALRQMKAAIRSLSTPAASAVRL